MWTAVVSTALDATFGGVTVSERIYGVLFRLESKAARSAALHIIPYRSIFRLDVKISTVKLRLMSADDPTPEIQSGGNRRTPHWPHAPEHRLSEGGTFIVTAGTYRKEHFFAGDARLKELHDGLIRYAAKYGWKLEAWAVFPNHYHFVGHPPENAVDGAASLRVFLADFHQNSAAWVNGLDGVKGRKVWHNFWETRLTYEKSYFARLNYVHQNAVRHGLVLVANQYPWCSAAWFEREAEPAMVKTIYGFKTDQVKVLDEF